MKDVPVMLRVRGRRCVLVGGGAVATRRCRTLLDAGAQVVVVAPQVSPEILAMGVEVRQRPVEAADVAGCFLVVVATDDPSVGSLVADAATGLVAHAGDPPRSDVQFMAATHQGPVTLAVHTGNISAAAAATIRDQVASRLDPLWPRLLEAAAPHRRAIQDRFAADATRRRDRLRRLTDEHAFAILRDQGQEALERHFQRLLDEP